MVSHLKELNAQEYAEALAELKLSVYASPKVLGVSLRQSQRYASEDQNVALPTSQHLRLLQLHVRDLKKTRERLLKQIEAFESGRGRIYNNRVDVTAKTLSEVKRQLSEIESLLKKHPSGLPPQI
jgi:hypothetical protein